MGKANNPFYRIFSYVVTGAVVVAIGACSADPALVLQSGRMVGLVGLEGRWAGPVVPSGAACGITSTGLMNIGGKQFAFDPFQSTVVIRGNVLDGRLLGSLDRVGGDRQPIRIELNASVVKTPDGGDAIEGKLVSGPCAWQVSLRRR